MDANLGFRMVITQIIDHFNMDLSREVGRVVSVRHVMNAQRERHLSFNKEPELLASISRKIIRLTNYSNKIHGKGRKER